MKVRLSHRANEDLVEISQWFDNISPNLADRFMEQFQGATRQIGRFPRAAAVRGEYGPQLRLVSIRPYVILYRVVADEVLVSRVIDGRRDVKAALDEG